jgi:hypothetical protein
LKRKEKKIFHTRQRKQHNPVEDEHGPEDGHVKHAEPRARKANGQRARRRVPELELGQAPDEGAELLVLLRWQPPATITAAAATTTANRAVLHFGVLLH